MASPFHIRMATLEDAARILEIYKPNITDSSISFEIDVPAVSEIESRLKTVLAKYPWLVCEVNGQIAGYAYAGMFRSRAAYDRSVEAAIYIGSEFHGQGVATALYTELFKRLRSAGFTTVIAGVTLPNEASIALHEKFGFKKVAHLKKIGFKFGQWWDVGYWQLIF